MAESLGVIAVVMMLTLALVFWLSVRLSYKRAST